MQQNKQIIQFSDHIKNKIKSQQITPISFSSDELILSDNDSVVSTFTEKSFHKRNSTFVTYQIQPRINLKQTQLCQECLHREKLLQIEHENLLQIQKENKKLSEQIRLLNLINHQYQDENIRLKANLTKINFHLHEYQINFNLLKQKFISEKTNQTKQDIEDQQLRRLRHEMQVYNQVIAEKRRKEQKQIDYFSHFRNK